MTASNEDVRVKTYKTKQEFDADAPMLVAQGWQVLAVDDNPGAPAGDLVRIIGGT